MLHSSDENLMIHEIPLLFFFLDISMSPSLHIIFYLLVVITAVRQRLLYSLHCSELDCMCLDKTSTEILHLLTEGEIQQYDAISHILK